MTAKTKSTARRAARPASPPAEDGPPTGPWATAPRTPEERLRRIEALGRQITEYVGFMCQAGTLGGTSAEAKEKALAAFYDRLVVAERQLGRIHDELRLG
jgi:hypothetical protein